jgi:phosphate acetyltransferase/phosphate butyryltransferase
MEYLENRTFDEINVGDTASLSRMLTEKDIKVFAIMSGDINPAHVDLEYAESEMFHKIIGHGMWGVSLISTVLGTELPGPGTIYVSQTIRFKKPVAIGDTLTVSVTAIEKKPEKNRIVFDCKCVNQLNETVIEGQAEVIAPAKKIRRPKAVLPEISLRRPYSLIEPYLEQAKKYDPLRSAVIYPLHEKIMQAVEHAKTQGLIIPVLIGPKDSIKKIASDAKIDLTKYEIIDCEHVQAAIQKAINLARDNDVELIIRGGATRDDLLHAMQKHEKGILTDRCLSYAAVVDVPTYAKALILTDAMINVNPTLDVKRGILQNAIDFAHALGIAQPKVAIIAGSDVISNSMQSTVDAAALCKMAERGQISGAVLDGPLTFDNAISAESAEEKGIVSPVIGDADILLVPNLETGNILLNQLEYLAESKNIGLVLGGRVPVLMSHINDIYLSTVSCALAILNKHKEK